MLSHIFMFGQKQNYISNVCDLHSGKGSGWPSHRHLLFWRWSQRVSKKTKKIRCTTKRVFDVIFSLSQSFQTVLTTAAYSEDFFFKLFTLFLNFCYDFFFLFLFVFGGWLTVFIWFKFISLGEKIINRLAWTGESLRRCIESI